jgi:hypothetical protein
MSNEELKIRKELARNEKERDRSRKWFFINLFAATFCILFTLWLFPFLMEVVAKQLKWLSKEGTVATDLTKWTNVVRLNYLQWSVFFLWVADASLWLFWVVFRFRKWTGYRHQVNVLKEELDKLEAEEKKN